LIRLARLIALAWLAPALCLAAPITLTPPPAPLPPLAPADAAAVVSAWRDAAAQGLTPRDLGPQLAALSNPDPAAHAKAETSLVQAAIDYANAERGMTLDPRRIESDFALRAPFDAAGDFNRARMAGQARAWVEGQSRHDEPFLALVAAYERYAQIAARGGWEKIPAGKPIKAGMRDPRAPALRARLSAEGYEAATPADPSAPTLVDPALAAALADFQTHHGLKGDGVLDAATLKALNVSAKERLATLAANLERARWAPIAMPAERIEADVGAPDVTLYQNDKPTLAMRAIVGKPNWRTPTFASVVTGVEFNPPWIVPAKIAARELFPKERRSPGYFAREGMYVSGGKVIQRAGPKSALGYIKFEVPNPFTIYLHDTPARNLFARDYRWLSHGCVRLQSPKELAAILLQPDGWKPEDVDAAIAAKRTRTWPLKVKPPVYFLYRTALAGPDGKVTFRTDVYGWDATLTAAMNGKPVSEPVDRGRKAGL
jgi:murein L,D-transpeptidase YcbB/YkuD